MIVEGGKLLISQHDVGLRFRCTGAVEVLRTVNHLIDKVIATGTQTEHGTQIYFMSEVHVFA